MIKTLIIEDEINSQELLTQMLRAYCPQVQVMGVAGSVSNAIPLIEKNQPDLIFFDVEIIGGNGFDILEAFEKINFKVIFITGYDHYAIQAIKHSAIDYILKPINIEELKTAVKRVEELAFDQDVAISFLKTHRASIDDELEQVVLADTKNHRIIKIAEISFIEANRSYSLFSLKNGDHIIASKSLQFYEDLLPKKIFFRIHKSYVVNVTDVKSIDKGRGGTIQMTNGKSIPIAVRRKPAFVHFIDSLS